ncbi:MAG: radical SAM protein [Pseudomonadota bacterium]
MPGYLKLLKQGELTQRIEQLFLLLSPCRLCPLKCGADRLQGKTGKCKASDTLRVAKAIPHFGEEPVISGTRGSGTIFFSHCNLTCCFCQNYQISQEELGGTVTIEELSAMMLSLQEQGCHNINVVSAAHYMPFIVQALYRAACQGLAIPLVYNTNGYEDTRLLELLEGIVDIYLPDAKYADDGLALKYSGIKNYTAINLKALEEMFRQTAYLEINEAGLAVKGLLVRHLLLPNRLAGTEQVLAVLKQHFGRFLAISLMGQYRPCYAASAYPELSRTTTAEEYGAAVAMLDALGFENGWVQDLGNLDRSFVPDFRKKDSWS